MKDIRGYTAEEIAESKKQQLEDDYHFIIGKTEEINRHQKEIDNIRKVVKELKTGYRIKSVDRVLGYIRTKGITDAKELDILLCHCQNKLNGNLDGVEITLDWSDEE